MKNSANVSLEVLNPVIEYGENITVTGEVRGTRTNVTLTYELVSSEVNGTMPDNTATNNTVINGVSNGSIVSRVISTDSSGVFFYEYSLNKTGKWRVWATWNGSETYFGASSNHENFTVMKDYITVTCNVTSKSVTIGDNVTITEFIYPAVENLTINLLLSSANSTINQTAITNVNGTYLASCKPETMGLW